MPSVFDLLDSDQYNDNADFDSRDGCLSCFSQPCTVCLKCHTCDDPDLYHEIVSDGAHAPKE